MSMTILDKSNYFWLLDVDFLLIIIIINWINNTLFTPTPPAKIFYFQDLKLINNSNIYSKIDLISLISDSLMTMLQVSATIVEIFETMELPFLLMKERIIVFKREWKGPSRISENRKKCIEYSQDDNGLHTLTSIGTEITAPSMKITSKMTCFVGV